MVTSQKDTIQTDCVLLPYDFPHQPPRGYEYKAFSYKTNVISIWTVYQPGFTYNGNAESYCIWGFYNTKTKQYHAPVNSKTVGKVVDINDTTPYTSMPLKLNPLEYAFLHS